VKNNHCCQFPLDSTLTPFSISINRANLRQKNRKSFCVKISEKNAFHIPNKKQINKKRI